MSTQVPDTQPDRDLQYQELIDILMSSKHFATLRGKLGQRPFDSAALDEDDQFCNSHFSRMLYEERTPTDALKAFEAQKSAERAMLNLAAKLRRDYKHYALIELLRALHDPEYVLPFEEVPLDKTVPVVLYMLDPEMVFAMMRWLKEATQDDLSELSRSGPLKQLRGACKRNQRLLSIIFGNSGWWVGGNPHPSAFEPGTTLFDLMQRFSHQVHPDFGVDWEHDTPLWWQGSQGVFPHMFSGFDSPSWGDVRMPDITSLWKTREMERRYVGAFAYLRRGTQDEVLRGVPRKEQKRIASWQFHLPLIFTRSLRTTSIGTDFARLQITFCPEHEHAKWQKRFPAFASRGVNQGLGAVVAHPGLDVKPFVEKAHRNPEIHNHFVLCTPEVTKRFVEERNADMKHKRYLHEKIAQQREALYGTRDA